jgi:hypothetical protein
LETKTNQSTKTPTQPKKKITIPKYQTKNENKIKSSISAGAYRVHRIGPVPGPLAGDDDNVDRGFE